MKSGISALLLTLTVLATPNLHAAANHEHHDHGHADQKATTLQLNAGKKWATDPALRQAMLSINQAMSKAHGKIHQDTFSDDQYRDLAAKISQNVSHIVENCKLEAKADAMLHLVIADLLSGADMMAGKTPGSRHDGAHQVFKSLEAYGKYFQHPGWKIAQS